MATEDTYTCPMHLEIRQPVPGTCPRCGMALDDLTAYKRLRAEELWDGESANLRRLG
jgi:hypothetical protein